MRVATTPCCSAASMLDLLALASRVAITETAILIEGEAGTGKGVLAAVIHQRSLRRLQPLHVLDCVALAAGRDADVLGQIADQHAGLQPRRGALGQGGAGTLLLDEVGALPPELQRALLRVLDQRTVRRIGADGVHRIDVRIVASSSSDLRAAVRAGRFRADLFQRLAVVRLPVPPLRERRGEVARLVGAHLPSPAAVPPDVLAALEAHAWPGNVRELRSVVEHQRMFGWASALEAYRIAPAPLDVPLAPRLGEADCAALARFEADHCAFLLGRLGRTRVPVAISR